MVCVFTVGEAHTMQQIQTIPPTIEQNLMLNRLASPLRWFSSTWQVQLIGSQNLSGADSLVIVSAGQGPLLETLREMQPLRESYLRNYLIVEVHDSEPHRSTAIRSIMDVARRENRVIIPAAAKARPTLSLPLLAKNRFPLPRALVVVCVEAPFEIPDHPAEIPSAWINAVDYLLKVAAGRALDKALS
jgi:hypothetical protein